MIPEYQWEGFRDCRLKRGASYNYDRTSLKKMKLGWSLLTLCLLQLCDSYKILVMFNMPSRSHDILGRGVVKHLLEVGHEVTYVTAFPRDDPPPRLHQVDVSDLLDDNLTASALNMTRILNNEQPINPLNMFKFIDMLTSKTMENPNLAKVLGDTNQTFDIVIAEWIFVDIYAGLASVFDCPLVWVSTIESHWMILQLVDERINPAYVPDLLSSNVPPFTFKERVGELLYMIFGVTIKTLYFNNYEKREFERLLGAYIKQRGRPIPSFDDVRYNASLVLGNSHVSYGLAHKLPQNYISIGGYHIDKEVKPLPNDLKNLLDNARNGVIYFSMGSNLKSKNIPEVLKNGLLKLFSELNQTVIWKFEGILPDIPKNVHIVKWAPQQSILAHSNCILFITHGGMLSTTEAIHFGKPIIGIPVFGDQFNNIDRAVQKGYAKRVDLTYQMVDELRKTIEEMLNNSKYTEVAKRLSLVYHDRPVSPGDELVHWVEHVIRTNGAPHLRSPALDMPFYQKMYLDLAALIIAIIFIIKIVIKRLYSLTIVNIKKKTN